jgi:hypothetical protein
VSSAKRDLRRQFPSGAYANLIHESGPEARPLRAFVQDVADFTLIAPCAGTFYVGIYRDREAVEPEFVVPVPAMEEGQHVHFG